MKLWRRVYEAEMPKTPRVFVDKNPLNTPRPCEPETSTTTGFSSNPDQGNFYFKYPTGSPRRSTNPTPAPPSAHNNEWSWFKCWFCVARDDDRRVDQRGEAIPWVTTPRVMKCGHLERRGLRVFDVKWRRTWVELDGQTLSVYDETPEGERTLVARGTLTEQHEIKQVCATEWQIMPPDSAETECRDFAFTLSTAGAAIADEWIEAIKKQCIKKIPIPSLSGRPMSTSTEEKNPVSPSETTKSTSSPVNNGHSSRRHSNGKSKRSH